MNWHPETEAFIVSLVVVAASAIAICWLGITLLSGGPQ